MYPRDYGAISFPALGIEVNPPRSIALGPMNIYFYGIVIAAGLLLAALYCSRRSREFGLTEDHVFDGILWVTPFAIVCARIYYVAFSWQDYAANPISVLYIWEGGIAIYGAVIGGAVGAVVGLVLRREPGRAGTIAAAAVINEIIAVIAAKEGFKLAGEIPPPQRA